MAGQRLRTAVIPAAGLGTRLLPQTRAVPKELLPVGGRPAIEWVIEESVSAGIEHLIVVWSAHKPTIAPYLGRLVDELRVHGSDVADAPPLSIEVVHQSVPAGLGDAVRVGAAVVAGEPFAVLLPDEILLSGARVLRRMVDAFHREGERSVSLMEVDISEIGGYGCAAVAPFPLADEQWRVTGCVEKPEPSLAPSSFALSGRYVLGPEVVDYLDSTVPDKKGEIQLTSALHEQAQGGQLSGFVVRPADGRVDVGNWRGWLDANVRAFAEHAPAAALAGVVVN